MNESPLKDALIAFGCGVSAAIRGRVRMRYDEMRCAVNFRFTTPELPFVNYALSIDMYRLQFYDEPYASDVLQRHAHQVITAFERARAQQLL
jgi:hypothetical protein